MSRLSDAVAEEQSNSNRYDILKKELDSIQGRPKVERIPSKSRSRKTANFVRLIVPDSHGYHISRPAAAAMLDDIKSLDVKEVILLGDHIDCGGFLAQHHTIGFVAETDAAYIDDVQAANEFFDRLQKAAPSAEYHYLLGNHEERIEKYCVTSSLAKRKDAQFLLDAFGPAAVIGAKQRGFNLYRSSIRYDDLPVPGTIRRGQCCFTHGISFATHAAHVHAQSFGINVVFGHTHRSQSTLLRTVANGVIGAWCPGCLCQLQPLYHATRPNNWTHGYAIQMVNRDGTFFHINVPIVDGKSMLCNLLGAIK